jgi:type IX secretion system PorP/SprF family membrane protein
VRKASFILFFLFHGYLAIGQQLPLYSQYLYNKFLLNPAVAGSDGYTSVNLTAREQWVGYSGAPRTFSVSMQTRMLKRSYILKGSSARKQTFRPKTDGKVGLGGYVFSDKNGLIKRTGFQLSYAYHTWLQNSTQLSFGLALSAYHFKVDEEEINFQDPDLAWMNNSLRKGMFVPDAAVGIYLLNAKYSIGLSSDQLFEGAAKIGSEAYQNYKMLRHYYLFGSYDFMIDRHNTFQPSMLIMTSEEFHPQADIGITYIHDQDFWLGLAYRTSGALISNVGVKYENIFIGYAFDFTLQEIQRITYGTHEITFAVKFGDNTRRYRWLDRY